MSLQRNRRADRIDRVVLTVLGLLALAAGLAALLVGAGVFGDDAASATLLPPSVQDALDDHGAWIALGGAVVLAVVGSLAAAWLLFLLRPVPAAPTLRLTDLDATGDGAGADTAGVAGRAAGGAPGGRVSIAPGALVAALERELERLPGVSGASVRLPDRRPVEVHAALDLEDGAEVAAVLSRIDGEVREHLTAATGLHDVHLLVELEPGTERPARVA